MNKNKICGISNIMDVVNKGEIYLTFVFDGIDSSEMNVVSISDGTTYDTPIMPSFTDNVLEVDGYNGRYYFNTRSTEKTFNYTCFIDNLSGNDFDRLKSWLRYDKIGKLIRPEEPYLYYWVKISSIENLPNIPLTNPYTGGVSYTGTFNISFTTVGQNCGYGMFYYKNDLEYYEHGNYFDMNKNGFYDSGLLYKEQIIDNNKSYKKGNYNILLYNPGTYSSKLILTIGTENDIINGNITITNKTTGDMSIIKLDEITNSDTLYIDWDKNSYMKNNENYIKNVSGDIIYVNGRDLIEDLNESTIYNDSNNSFVSFDKENHIVKKDNVGKILMFNDGQKGNGGKIIDIDRENNSYKLDATVGLYELAQHDILITRLDDIEISINIEDNKEIILNWSLIPRYI